MVTAKAKYIVDEKGRKKAVVLDLREYQKILKRLEDLEDALDLDEAVKTAKGFTPYELFRKELQQEGRL